MCLIIMLAIGDFVSQLLVLIWGTKSGRKIFNSFDGDGSQDLDFEEVQAAGLGITLP